MKKNKLKNLMSYGKKIHFIPHYILSVSTKKKTFGH